MEEENRSMVWVLVVGVVLIVVAIFLLLQNNAANNAPVTVDTNDDIELADDDLDEVDDTPNTVFALTEQNESGQNGTAVFTEIGEQVEVAITLSSSTDTPEPAHIHTGRCPVPGGVVYPLNDIVNGSSVTLLDTTLATLMSQGELALNIHKSAAESSVYFSCGNLDF